MPGRPEAEPYDVYVTITALSSTILTVFFATTVAAIRGASRTRLTELLESRGGEETVERLFVLRRPYTRVALVGHQIGVAAFIVLMVISTAEIESMAARWAGVAIMSLLWVFVFSIGVPVGWARYAGDRYLAAILPLLEVLRRIGRPALFIINGVEEVVRRLSGSPREAADRSEQIELQIMDAVSHGETSGAMDDAEKEIIKSALALDEKSVAEAMTPRTDIVGIDVTATLAEVREALLSEGHSRVPVYEDSVDHVIGMLYAKDLLRIEDPGEFDLRKLMRPVMFVPETKDLSSLLREFQAGRVHVAIVLDEYGGTAGLVTLEDIMEELIGDIADEHEEPEAPSINRIDDRTADVEARVHVEDLNETFGIELPVDEAYDTIAGYVFSKLGRIPAVGEIAAENGVRIEVLEADDRSIGRLRLHLPEPVPVEE